MKFNLVLFCYNSSKNIISCIEKIKKIEKHVEKIFFIDNFSTDNSVLLLRKNKINFNLNYKIIENRSNLGLGGSWKKILKILVKEKNKNVLFLQTNGKSNIDLVIRELVNEKLKNKNLDLIFASRFHDKSNIKNYSKVRKVGNILFNYLTRLLTNSQFQDSGCAIAYINLKLLNDIDYLSFTNGPQFNPELNIELFKKKPNYAEIPIMWNEGKVPSSINGMSYTLKLIRILLNKCFNNFFSKTLKNLKSVSFKVKFLFLIFPINIWIFSYLNKLNIYENFSLHDAIFISLSLFLIVFYFKKKLDKKFFCFFIYLYAVLFFSKYINLNCDDLKLHQINFCKSL